MITPKPADRLTKNFRIVAIVIGICLAFVVLTTAAVLIVMPSYKRTNVPFVVWVNAVVLILGVVAYVQFVASRFKKSKSLRLFLVFCSFINFVSFCFNSFILLYPLYSNVANREAAIENLIMAAILGAADFISVILLQKARVPKLDNAQNVQGKRRPFQPLGKVQRMIHLVLDMIVVVFMVGLHLILVNDFFRTDILTITAIITMIIAYYFVMETVLKTTVGKVITNSIIIDEKGKKASLARILLRALCRFIPLDAASFLFADRGWHDKLSGTYIINDRYTWEDEEDALSSYFTGDPETETTTTLVL